MDTNDLIMVLKDEVMRERVLSQIVYENNNRYLMKCLVRDLNTIEGCIRHMKKLLTKEYGNN